MDVCLDFTEANAEAKNIQVVNAPSGVVRDTLQAYQTKLVAIVRAYDTEWTTKCAIRVVKRAPNDKGQRELIGGQDGSRDLEEAIEAWQGVSPGWNVDEVRDQARLKGH